MKLLFTNITNLKNEKGQSAITLALLSITFLLLSGFSLDTANLLLKKSHLQRALDAGAIAGITRYDSGDNSGTIATTAQEMALYNLQEMGLPNAEVAANFAVDQDQVATLSLNGSVNTSTLFMRLIPGAGLGTVVTAASSTARRNPAIVSLVLDVSGSMAPNITALRKAANDFVDSFENGLDQMAIIKFSDRASVIAAMAPVDKTSLHAKINGLGAGGWTGTAEGVVLGRKELEKVANPAAVRAMLLFTDGAPNVIRPIFTDGNSAFLPKNYPSSGPQNYDYYAYLNTPLGGTPRPEIHHPQTLAEVCTNARRIEQCLNSFAYNDSRGNLGHFAHITSLVSPYTEMKKEAYDLAILETDYAKSDGITIYTVGLGLEAPNTGDPYQNVNEIQRLKPIFLRRLANDPASATDPSFPNLPANNSHPVGTYLQTPNPSDLTNLFKTIAQKIKLRLIQ